jgi:hypothetical protein
MRPSPALRDLAARFITNRIEAVLESEFVVAPLRVNAELAEALKELQQTRPSAQGVQVNGIVTIEPDADNGKPAVKVTAYSANQECQRTAPLIAVGEIKDPPDDPDAFFKYAAQKLPNRNVARVVVVRPVAGNGISSRTAERLQNLLATAIRNAFQDRRHLLVSDEPTPPVDLQDNEMAVSGAWQARLHLAASPQGIDVRVEVRGPDSQPGGSDVTGHFALENTVAAEAWAATKDTTSIAVLDDFIRQFGDTPYGSMARARREELRARAAAAQPPAATPAPRPPDATLTQRPPVMRPTQRPPIVRQTEPEHAFGADAIRTASAFYRALSQGDGSAAAALVIPEKRGKGNFNPAKMTEFYSTMIRRLAVEDITALDDTVVAVRYSYVHPSKVCSNERAMVTTVHRDGRTLIESISARC